MGGNLYLFTGIFSAGGRSEPFEDYFNHLVDSGAVMRLAWRRLACCRAGLGGMHTATIGTGPVQAGAYCTSPGVLTCLVSRSVRG
ncbi:hypothetical protein [Tahibacter sp.]|uniref:hypothetical protein n=1 Tax=Tahibacter sp. TaxID=2056211 RepID=UPI0028C507B4|nr:hypothetical protein [Tahibacter sp.]